jgi:hypothetical protein
MEPMKPSWRAALLLGPLLFSACSTPPRPASPAPPPTSAPLSSPGSSSSAPTPAPVIPDASSPAPEKPEPAATAVVPTRRPGASKPVPTVPSPETPKGEYAVRVHSEPSGATVVFNGVPVGKTPYRLVLAGSSRGFFKEPCLLKVRFIAKDAEHASTTIEEEFTPREKIPAEVCFTREGVKRVAR